MSSLPHGDPLRSQIWRKLAAELDKGDQVYSAAQAFLLGCDFGAALRVRPLGRSLPHECSRWPSAAGVSPPRRTSSRSFRSTTPWRMLSKRTFTFGEALVACVADAPSATASLLGRGDVAGAAVRADRLRSPAGRVCACAVRHLQVCIESVPPSWATFSGSVAALAAAPGEVADAGEKLLGVSQSGWVHLVVWLMKVDGGCIGVNGECDSACAAEGLRTVSSCAAPDVCVKRAQVAGKGSIPAAAALLRAAFPDSFPHMLTHELQEKWQHLVRWR